MDVAKMIWILCRNVNGSKTAAAAAAVARGQV